MWIRKAKMELMQEQIDDLYKRVRELEKNVTIEEFLPTPTHATDYPYQQIYTKRYKIRSVLKGLLKELNLDIEPESTQYTPLKVVRKDKK